MKKVFLTLTVILLSISFYPVKAMERAADILKKNVVTSGEGLYVDSTVEGRYIYRGGNPNNYIKLDDDLYRIMSLEKDGTIKVIKQESIGKMAWDKGGARYSKNGDDFCYLDGPHGCKSWGSNTTTLDANGNKVTQMPWDVNGTLRNLPDKDATLNTYLNNEFYNGLNDDVKGVVVEKTWNVGPTSDDQTNLSESIKEESAYKWKGKVALMNATDYIKASANSACTSAKDNSFDGNSLCHNINSINNYLTTNGGWTWTISPLAYSGPYDVCSVFDYSIPPLYLGSQNSYGYDVGNSVRPAFYLSSETTLTGKGTEINPYTLPKRNDVTEEPKFEENNKGDVKVDDGQVVEVPSTSAFGSIIIAGLGIVCVTGSALVMKRTTGRGK